MTKNEIFKNIIGFLNKDVFINTTFGKNREFITKSFITMKKDINDLENDNKYTSKSKDHDEIFKTVSIIRNIIKEIPVTLEMNKFFFSWCELVMNWNNNTIKENGLNYDCMSIIRLLNNHYSIKDATEILKELNGRLKNFKNWSPPQFEIAKHFLNYLES